MKGEETESLFAFDSLHSAYCSPEFPAHSCLSPTFTVSGFGWNVSVGAKQYQEQTNREKTSEDVGSGCNIDLAISSRAPEVTRHSRLLASQPETSQVGFTRKRAPPALLMGGQRPREKRCRNQCRRDESHIRNPRVESRSIGKPPAGDCP